MYYVQLYNGNEIIELLIAHCSLLTTKLLMYYSLYLLEWEIETSYADTDLTIMLIIKKLLIHWCDNCCVCVLSVERNENTDRIQKTKAKKDQHPREIYLRHGHHFTIR